MIDIEDEGKEKWNIEPYSRREWGLVIVSILLMLGMILTMYGSRTTVKGYIIAYDECEKNLYNVQHGILPLNDDYTTQVNLSLPIK